MAKNASLVLDLGCNKIKFGFAGESHPRITSRAFYGTTQSYFDNDMIQEDGELSYPIIPNRSMPLQKYKFGEELKANNPNYEYKKLFEINSPSENGYCTTQPRINSDLLCDLYTKELCPSLNISPHYLPLLLGEPNNDTEIFRESLIQLVENASIPKIFIRKKAVL